MSSTAPIIASSSSTMSLPSREMHNIHVFKLYVEKIFKIPADLTHDIAYCQKAFKTHVKVHQMVLEVFEQQPYANPQQMTQIINELESELIEINAEQSFLMLRLRRIIDDFMTTLIKHGVPTHTPTINAYVNRIMVPLIDDTTLEIVPTTVMPRNTEEQLIEKYFEVERDTIPEPVYEDMEIIDLDDDDDDEGKVVEQQTIYKAPVNRKEHFNNAAVMGESLLKNLQANMAPQPSLLKPFNQRMTHDLMTLDVKPNIVKPVKTLGDLYQQKKEEALISQRMAQDLMEVDVNPTFVKPVKTLGDLYQQKKEEKDEAIELPVSTNVKKSRMNLTQALKRAQAAVRGPTSVAIPAPPPPPPTPAPVEMTSVDAQVVKKSKAAKTRATRAAASAAAAAAFATSTVSQKSSSSSSEGGTPERGHTPPHNYWPDEFEETRTKPDEYGQEMFLRLFDLFTPEHHAQLQQRRSKRRRRCVKNNNYHYDSIDYRHAEALNEPENKNKTKRKAFLLSPQVKKTKRAKRRSADNVSETQSAQPSRSASRSPKDKRTCNECLKAGKNLEKCDECKLYYHAKCHRKEDNPMVADDSKQNSNDFKKCPGCKKKHDKDIKDEFVLHKKLQCCAQDLELQMAKEKDRNEILQRTGKSYKIQMNNIFEIINSFKTEPSTSKSADENIVYDLGNM